MDYKLSTLLLFISFQFFTVVYSQNHVFDWVKQATGSGEDQGSCIRLDAEDNVITCGFFTSTVDFDPSASVLNLSSNGGADIYIHKMDINGNIIWAKSIGGSNIDQGHSLAIDENQNIYVTGNFMGTVDFDPGIGVSNLSSSGFIDIFILKLDSNGNYVWAKKIGQTGTNKGLSIALDENANVITTGFFENNTDFNPGVGSYFLNPPDLTSENSYVLKLDLNGNFIWAKIIGVPYDRVSSIATDFDGNICLTGDGDSGGFIQKLNPAGDLVWQKSLFLGSYIDANAISIDEIGNIYTTGDFGGTIDFNSGPGSFLLTSISPGDAYILKLDPDGDFVWARNMGGVNGTQGYGITTDVDGNVYSVGYFDYTSDFDPGLGVANLTVNGDYDIYIQKLDSLGNFVWVKQIGGSSYDKGLSVALDSFGSLYTTGNFLGQVDFDPGVNVANLICPNERDIFILKLNKCQTTITTDIHNTCGPFTWIDGNTYTVSNDTATFVFSLDSGCDSIVKLDLTIQNNSAVDIQFACDSIKWIDGNNYYTSNNTATWTLINSFGCDSVVMLDLTINTIDNTVIQLNDVTLQSSENNATFQWLNCDNGFAIIDNETNQSFEVLSNGNYAVQITKNGCVDTSACVPINKVELTNVFFENDFSVYPNPSADNVIINFNEELPFIELTIFDVKGKKIKTDYYRTISKIDLSLLNFDAGVYFIDINTLTDNYKIRIIKK